MKKLTLQEYVKTINALPEALEEAALRGIREAAARGVGRVVEAIQNTEPHAAVNTGELQQSVRFYNIPTGAVITVEAPHASIVEHGSRPHWPPHDPIKAWVLRKGLTDDDDEADEIAFAIRFTIAAFGTEPRHYFRKAIKIVRKTDIPFFVKEELKRL